MLLPNPCTSASSTVRPPVSFFLQGPVGNLFAMYYPPSESTAEAGDVLYVHPFADEMPASRNVIASVSRDLARMGFGVMMIDLSGCGDSEGEFGEARWESWRQDLAAAVGWLRERGRDRVSLWGLRLGAFLALDFAVQSRESYERIVLWEPVLNGQALMTEFLRMHLDEARDGLVAKQWTDPETREGLASGDRVEIAGYELGAELIRSIDKLNLVTLGRTLRCPIHWVEVGTKFGHSLRRESVSVIDEWKNRGVRVLPHQISASPFWLFPYSADPQRLSAALPAMFSEAES